jgi:ElaA protein
MEEAIALCKYYWPNREVKISAQTYLLDFYMQLGFYSIGKEYEEDGIPHTEMILTN